MTSEESKSASASLQPTGTCCSGYPVSSEHTRSPHLAAKRKRERRAAKEARAQEAEEARKAAKKAADEVARMGRAASRSIARD